MFAIYDIEGRRFRGTLESLRQVQKTQASLGIQLRSNVADEETQSITDTTGGKSTGEIVSENALRAYREMRHLNQRERIYHAHQLMSFPVSTVRMDMDILAARRYFQQQGVRQMPVLDGQQHIVGMLSVEDLLRFIIIDGDQVRYLRGKQVADAMSKDVITSDPVSDIRRVAHAMQEYHLHGVPIVDERDLLIGIVSRGDILRAMINDPPLDLWT
jgi:CBS domain-containing protein